jgi:N-acylneuraminate cytidylyltransferase
MDRKIIAFIPVRGGSKSIPLKNIKDFCGKPLVCWNIEALQNSDRIDEIVVATDSKEIKQTLKGYNYSKVTIFNRNEENAKDNASTESVMLEYIESDESNLADDDLFILAQATSPLTQSIHFKEALELFSTSGYDSLITCVRSYRFFWNENGTSKNYDYRERPRRQDFNGTLMENGAFYINTVKNVKTYRNRLSGKIGIYEMPEYTSAEIDEPDDWAYLENLMQKYILKNNKRKELADIKLFLSDVDGVLTDGGMYYSENGDELKKFNTRDGMAFQILKEKGIKIGLVTSENTKIVENRAKKLKMDYLIQGKAFGGKLEAVKALCTKENIKLSEVAYVGDDLNCIDLLSSVGFAFCPKDACTKIIDIKNIKVVNKNGGDGVIRNIIDYLKM